MEIALVGSSILNLKDFISINFQYHDNCGVIMTVEHPGSIQEFLFPEETDPEWVAANVASFLHQSRTYDLLRYLRLRKAKMEVEENDDDSSSAENFRQNCH